MPEESEYLLSNIGFSRDETPYLSLQKDDTVTNLAPLGKTMTLRFNIAQRFCIGWGNIATGERFACPNQHTLEGKYEQCAACQQRTGFNPAFYNASSVSAQQEARNLEPHLLYLAYFGKGIIKVGISHAARGNARLLEQGARLALVLDTFPSAHIARQYEARIAALPGIVETIQLRKKIDTLSLPIDETAAIQELTTTRTTIEQLLGLSFAPSEVMTLHTRYFPGELVALSDSYNCSDQHCVSGKVTGMLGPFLFCRYQDTDVFLPLKKYIGYPCTLSYNETSLDIPARQISLF